jgi:hypothetical protein
LLRARLGARLLLARRRQLLVGSGLDLRGRLVVRREEVEVDVQVFVQRLGVADILALSYVPLRLVPVENVTDLFLKKLPPSPFI